MALSGLQGCNGTPDDQAGTVLPIGAQVEPGMPPSSSQRLLRDISELGQLDIQAAGNRFFTEVFGGGSRDDAIRYLDDRINYFIPTDLDVEQRLVVTGRFNQEPSSPSSGDEPVIGAANIGTPIWMLHEALKPQTVKVKFGNRLLEPSSSRFGLIMLGEGYSDRFPDIQRIGILVHEARHSDCTGGLSRGEFPRIRSGDTPAGVQCGHLHVECPPGHPYAGLPACDDHAWGAYSMDAIFLAVLSSTCRNCSEEQLQIALAGGDDSASRILVFDQMVNGDFGPPDMTSQGVVQ